MTQLIASFNVINENALRDWCGGIIGGEVGLAAAQIAVSIRASCPSESFSLTHRSRVISIMASRHCEGCSTWATCCCTKAPTRWTRPGWLALRGCRRHRRRSPDCGSRRDLREAAEIARLRPLRGRHPQCRCGGGVRGRRAGHARGSRLRTVRQRACAWFHGRPVARRLAATADYHAGQAPQIIMGRQLAGSSIGIIGYGSIGRYLAAWRRRSA